MGNMRRTAAEGGRAAECAGLENRRWATIRGFKSHPLRHIFKPISLNEMGFFVMACLLFFRLLSHGLLCRPLPPRFLETGRLPGNRYCPEPRPGQAGRGRCGRALRRGVYRSAAALII